jgi:hypothetical protein
MAIPGDIVRHENVDRVVVDVTDDGIAVLRASDDLELLNPIVAPADSLEVIGHLDFLDGWVELAPGEWEQT